MDNNSNETHKPKTHYTFECRWCHSRFTKFDCLTPAPNEGYGPCSQSPYNNEHDWMAVDE